MWQNKQQAEKKDAPERSQYAIPHYFKTTTKTKTTF